MESPTKDTNNTQDRVAWWKWMLFFILAPFVLYFTSLLLAVVGFVGVIVVAFAYLMIPYRFVSQKVRRRRFLRKIQDRGRYLTWEEASVQIESGEGTLIIEQFFNFSLCVRLWWTSDNVIAKTPFAPLTQKDFAFVCVGLPLPKSLRPFVTWCHNEYLSLETGTAFFIHKDIEVWLQKRSINTQSQKAVSALVKPEWDSPHYLSEVFFREIFPRIPLVMTFKIHV